MDKRDSKGRFIKGWKKSLLTTFVDDNPEILEKLILYIRNSKVVENKVTVEEIINLSG